MVNAPTANTVAAAEHGIALIAALSRNVAQADASIKAGRWERSKYTGVSIVGKTLAIMGFGKARPACLRDTRVRVRAEYMGVFIVGKTLAIMGFGKALARLRQGFGKARPGVACAIGYRV